MIVWIVVGVVAVVLVVLVATVAHIRPPPATPGGDVTGRAEHVAERADAAAAEARGLLAAVRETAAANHLVERIEDTLRGDDR